MPAVVGYFALWNKEFFYKALSLLVEKGKKYIWLCVRLTLLGAHPRTTRGLEAKRRGHRMPMIGTYKTQFSFCGLHEIFSF